jgi:peptide/nickel transport system substrate-binding protein
MKHWQPFTALQALMVSAALVSGCSEGERVQQQAVVLLDSAYGGSWPAGLDPATNTTARANLSMMNAIFGGLFQLTADEDGNNVAVRGVLASGYEIADGGTTLVIRLREGVQFSDGTPFDAEAVRFNIERNLASPCTCAPRDWPWVEQNRVTTPDHHTVGLHFTRPYGAAINAFPVSNANWIASPTALKNLGEDQFRITPIGAGPFRVVENRLSARLVLERNANYWESGRPLLERLIFQPIGSEQAAYQALLVGDAQAYEGMTSPSVIEQATKTSELRVTLQPATSPYVSQLNTTRPPFDNQLAREAIYYATNVEAIRGGIFYDWYPASQSFTGPGSLFHEASIPSYRTYDPQRARAIVEELGGLKVNLGTLRTFVAEQIVTALQTQWREAGIQVSIETNELPTLIQVFRSGEWQAILSTVGSYNQVGRTPGAARPGAQRPQIRSRRIARIAARQGCRLVGPGRGDRDRRDAARRDRQDRQDPAARAIQRRRNRLRSGRVRITRS